LGKKKFFDVHTGKELARCSCNTQYSAFGSNKIDYASKDAISEAIENMIKKLQAGKKI
jgi:hypothetical protein